MAMNVQPLGDREGLLVVNSLVLSRPQETVAAPADESLYLDINGLFHQCSHCRRMQQARAPKNWDWVPRLGRAFAGQHEPRHLPDVSRLPLPAEEEESAAWHSTVPGGLLVGV